MNERLIRMEQEQIQLEIRSLCPLEVRRILEDGRRECKASSACSNPEIGLFVSDADPTHEGRFLTMMGVQEHRAFYFKGPLPTPAAPGLRDPFYMAGAEKSISEQQFKRLRRLVQSRMLTTTQFLVVSHPGEHRDLLKAERMGNIIIDLILNIGITDHLDIKPARILHWIYPFTLQRGEKLRSEDRPPPGASLNQSVWVFRVDC